MLCDATLFTGTINAMDSKIILEPECALGLKGPWGAAFWIKIEDTIKSKSNYRRGNNKVQNWLPYRKFENDLSFIVSTKLPNNWEIGNREQSLKERPIIVAVIIAQSNLDSSNISKSILDACEGLVYLNDASVKTSITITEKPLKKNQDNKTILAFASLPPKATLEDQVKASTELLSQCKELFEND